MNRRWGAALMAATMLVGACARGGEKDDGIVGIAPQFPPEDPSAATSTTSTSAPAATSTTSTSKSSAGGRGGAATTSTTAAAAAAKTASITDPVGDLTPSPLDPPPPWADLAGATMIRRDTGFELRVRLGGGTAPSTTDSDHTMNIAAFYDINGDGQIDFEVWANLASRGWGSSYFDRNGDKAAFQDRSGVAVTVEGAEVVLRFPLTHLVHADRFRWSTASEWGRYEVLGTTATARDDAPDNDAPARFPA